MLTVDCFKSMCMLANSETGKQVKNYYLDLEKIFKEYVLRDIQSAIFNSEKSEYPLA
jgi:phage anti-repressor protein